MARYTRCNQLRVYFRVSDGNQAGGRPDKPSAIVPASRTGGVAAPERGRRLDERGAALCNGARPSVCFTG